MAFKNAGGGLGNMSQMLKQAQKLQAEMARTQEELQNKTVEASAGGGVVQVVVSGKMEVVELKIKPEAVDPEDVEMLEDLVKAAVNEGLRKAQEMTAAEMGKLTGGLKIPGLF
jgi:DNA-binding YbaB/EbfC family protein